MSDNRLDSSHLQHTTPSLVGRHCMRLISPLTADMPALCASVYRLLAASRRRDGTLLHAPSSHAHLKMMKAAFTCIEALCLTLVIHLK